MGRWEPDARGRLLRAALELFAQNGYEATTTAQIAERAGLTKTTLFRLFADKREVLFQGQPTLVALAENAIQQARDGEKSSGMVRAALLALSEAHVPEQKEIGLRIDLLVAANVDLRERAVFKRAAISTAMENALIGRGVDRRLAGVLADVGTRAYYDGFRLWSQPGQESRLAPLIMMEFAAFENIAATLVHADHSAAL